jgi:hypothetical protein
LSFRKFSGSGLWNVYLDSLSILNEELIKILQKLGADPGMVVIFESLEQERKNAYLHKDLIWKNNNWATVPCAINWELQPTQTIIQWFNTDFCNEYWPNADFNNTTWPKKYLNGIGYVPGDTDGVPDNAVLVQQAEINNTSPILFRTDVAHCVNFKSQWPNRFVFSLRFNNITTWDHAVEIFQKVFVDNN